MAETRIAFIGRAGTPHQDNYLNTLPLLDGVDRVDVCDLAGGPLFDEAHERMGSVFGSSFTDPDECLANGPYTMVVVSLDNLSSNPIVMKALEAENHVFAEKTAARTYAEYAPLERYARDHNLHLGMGYLNRYRPSVQDARRLIAEGAMDASTALTSNRSPRSRASATRHTTGRSAAKKQAADTSSGSDATTSTCYGMCRDRT